MSTVFPHPVLHQDSMDYDDPLAYSAEFSRSSKVAIEVEHRLKKNTLVASLVEQGKASFFCTVAAGGTVYRRTEKVENIDLKDELITARQKIELPTFRNRPEIFANAGVFNHAKIKICWSEAAGVDEFHRDEYLGFSDYALLAHKGWVRFFPMDALFQIKSEKNMPMGEFRSHTSFANSAIRIFITMAPKLFDEVVSDRDSPARSHILCAAMIIALKELRQIWEKNENGSREDEDGIHLEAAEGLKQYLEKNGIPTWEAEDFDPAESASKFKPVKTNDQLLEGE